MFESLGLVAVVLAIILILGAIVAGILLLRGRSRSGPMADGMRIGVLESIAVDGRRRLVLVRRDDVEHLVMIGGPSEFVVESNIGRSSARPLADSEASAAGQRAIKEAADRHDALPEPVAAAPAKFTFDETELLQGLDLSADPAAKAPAAPDIPRRREPAPIVTQTRTPPQTPPGAANDQRGFGDSGMRPRPANALNEGARETAQPETPEWKRRTDGTPTRPASGETNGTAIRRMSPIRPGGEERVRPSSEERLGPGSEERARPEPRRIPSAPETSPSAEQADIKRNRIPQRPEMPATRQLPSVTAAAQPANGPSTDETDIENEIVRALGMDTAPEPSQPAPAAQPPTAKPAAGEPRTRLGDLADRLEEALAREVRSAGHAKTRLDLDLDSFGFDRERGRNASNADRPQPAETSASGENNGTSRPSEPQREKPASGEPADMAKRESRVRPEQRQAEQRQDNPPVISLSARRREASDPLEDEMAHLLGELTDGGRR